MALRPSDRRLNLSGENFASIEVTSPMTINSRSTADLFSRRLPYVSTEMPLAHHAGAVATRLEELGQRRLRGGQAMAVFGPEGPVNAEAIGITAREQRRPGGGADGLGHVEIGKPNPLPGQPINVGRGCKATAEAGRIAVAHVIGKDDDHIRR